MIEVGEVQVCVELRQIIADWNTQAARGTVNDFGMQGNCSCAFYFFRDKPDQDLPIDAWVEFLHVELQAILGAFNVFQGFAHIGQAAVNTTPLDATVRSGYELTDPNRFHHIHNSMMNDAVLVLQPSYFAFFWGEYLEYFVFARAIGAVF